MLLIVLSLLVTFPEPEEQVYKRTFEQARANKMAVIICHGTPVPDGKWLAIYHSQKSPFSDTAIVVHRYNDRLNKLEFVGWAGDRKGIEELIK